MAEYPYVEYPYVLNTGSLKKLFAHVKAAGVPPKVTTRYLEACGFKSKNDRPIVNLLKIIDFISPDGTPTDNWKKYRDEKAGPSVLGSAITHAYHDLFTMYPDAHRRDESEVPSMGV